jgi:hypothetical protein
MRHLLMRMAVAFTITFGVLALRAAPAQAITSFAEVEFINNTSCQFSIPSAQWNVGSTWHTPYGAWPNPSAAPPMTVLAGQTVTWGSSSDGGGAFAGTGGKVIVNLPDVLAPDGQTKTEGQSATLAWSLPWTYFNWGLGGFGLQQPSTNDTKTSDGNLYRLDQGVVGCDATGDSCMFEYEVTFIGSGSPVGDCSHHDVLAGHLPIVPTTTVNGLAVLTSYYDSVRQAQYVFYEDSTGNIDTLSCGPGGCWNSQVALQAGLFATGSSLISYFDGTNGHLFFQGSMGSKDLITLAGNPPTSSSAMTDLTTTTNPVNGGTDGDFYLYTDTAGHQAAALAPASNLTGYWDGQVDHVFYLDGLGNAHETYYNGSWWDHIVAPASALAYPPSGILRSSWDGTNQHLYIGLSQGYGWYETSYPTDPWTPFAIPGSAALGPNLTAGGPYSSSISGLSQYAGWQYLFAGAGTNQVTSLYNTGDYNTGGGYSFFEMLNTPAVNYNILAPTLMYNDTGGPELFVVGQSNGHIYFSSQLGGAFTDLSTSPGNDGALVNIFGQNGAIAEFSPLSGYFDGGNDHLFYIDTAFNVQEIYWQPGSTYFQGHVIGGANSALGTGFIANYQQ